MSDLTVVFSKSDVIDAYIKKNNLPALYDRLTFFKQSKKMSPLIPIGKHDTTSKYSLKNFYHWHTGIGDVSLWYAVKRSGKYIRFMLLDLAKHDESGTSPGRDSSTKTQERFAGHLQSIVDGFMKKMNKESLNSSNTLSGTNPMKIITESSLPVSPKEARNKAALYATAWGVPEVTLSLNESFAIVEAAKDDTKEKVVFALDWKTQRPSVVEPETIKALTADGEEIEIDVNVFNYQDIHDVPAGSKIFSFKMNESLIFLEGTYGKCRKIAKTTAAALASSLGRDSMTVNLTEAIGKVNSYTKKIVKEGKTFNGIAKIDGKELSEVRSLTEANAAASIDRNIMASIIDTVINESMSISQKKSAEKNVKGMKANITDFRKRYGDDAKSVMYATANKLAQKESVEDDAYTAWQKEVIAANPNVKIRFVNKNDSGNLVVSAQVGDRSLGVFDLDTNSGELLGEGVNIQSKNVLGSFRTQDGKTHTYGTTKNKWALKHNLIHEIESGSKLAQNRYGIVKGNVAHIADTIDEASGTPTLTKHVIRHVWKNEATQSIEPVPVDELDEDVTSFTIEYEIKTADKTTDGKVTYQGKDANEAKQRFMDDHKDDGQVNVKSVQPVQADLNEDDGEVTDAAIGVNNTNDSAYVVYSDKTGKKFKKIRHGNVADITKQLEEEGCTVHSIADGKGTGMSKKAPVKPLDESESFDVEDVISGALTDAYSLAKQAKEQYDRTYTDPEDEPFDLKDSMASAFEDTIKSIIDQLESASMKASDKTDQYLSGKSIDEASITDVEQDEPLKESVKPMTKMDHYTNFATKFFGVSPK